MIGQSHSRMIMSWGDWLSSMGSDRLTRRLLSMGTFSSHENKISSKPEKEHNKETQNNFFKKG